MTPTNNMVKRNKLGKDLSASVLIGVVLGIIFGSILNLILVSTGYGQSTDSLSQPFVRIQSISDRTKVVPPGIYMTRTHWDRLATSYNSAVWAIHYRDSLNQSLVNSLDSLYNVYLQTRTDLQATQSKFDEAHQATEKLYAHHIETKARLAKITESAIRQRKLKYQFGAAGIISGLLIGIFVF